MTPIEAMPGAAHPVEAWRGGDRTTPPFDGNSRIVADLDREALGQVPAAS